MDFQSQYVAAANPNFQQRVSSALATVAVTIYGEANPPANHPARAAYAVVVITDAPVSMVTTNASGTLTPDKRVYAVARLLAAQGLDNSASDQAILAQIAADWNALAGA